MTGYTLYPQPNHYLPLPSHSIFSSFPVFFGKRKKDHASLFANIDLKDDKGIDRQHWSPRNGEEKKHVYLYRRTQRPLVQPVN